MSGLQPNTRELAADGSGDGRAGERALSGSDVIDQDVRRRVLSSFRLQIKLVVMIALILTLLGVMIFVIVQRIFDVLTPSIRHDLEWKARHSVIELSKTSELGVIANNRAAVQAAAQELIADADVVAVQVDGQNGAVLSHGELPFALGSVAEAANNTVIEHQGLLVASGPVEIEGLPIGRVTLAVSTQRMSAGEELRADILRAGAFSALAAFVLALLFVRYDITPLIRLTANAFVELERTTVAALQSARVKSEFLANMSHEIRTPMNGIMGVTKLLMMMPMEAKVRRYVEVIDSSARGLMTIINDVLDFSKLEAGKYKIRPTIFEPRSLVSDCAVLFGERAHERGLRLHVTIADDMPAWVVGDPDRIRQVLDNLVGNAVKFTAVGEVSIAMTLEVEADRSYLCLRVRDSGPGISAEDQQRLFQAFTQVDGSSVREHGGTGLGLAIVKRLTELMGGSVSLQSKIGQGSEFRVRIRVEMADAAGSSGHRQSQVPKSPEIERVREATEVAMVPAGSHSDAPAKSLGETMHPLRVLVVDDNEINRMVAVEHLHVLGFESDTASNGAEAVAAVFDRPYGLVLMDCQMPVMDGYTAATQIREREANEGLARIPIVALTAHVLDGERERVQEAGMDEHLPKPIHPEMLSALLSRFVGMPRRSESSGASAKVEVEATTAGAPGTLAKSDLARPVEVPVQPGPANQQTRELPEVLECSASIVGLFLRLAPAQLRELSAAVQARDAQQAKDKAHKFKGALYSVSANALASSVEALRGDLSAGDWVATTARLAQIEQRFAAVCAELQQGAAETGS